MYITYRYNDVASFHANEEVHALMRELKYHTSRSTIPGIKHVVVWPTPT